MQRELRLATGFFRQHIVIRNRVSGRAKPCFASYIKTPLDMYKSYLFVCEQVRVGIKKARAAACASLPPLSLKMRDIVLQKQRSKHGMPKSLFDEVRLAASSHNTPPCAREGLSSRLDILA